MCVCVCTTHWQVRGPLNIDIAAAPDRPYGKMVDRERVVEREREREQAQFVARIANGLKHVLIYTHTDTHTYTERHTLACM